MNYFIDSPDWIDLVLDQELFRDIQDHHQALSRPLNIEGIDGFYFVDNQGYAILIDSKGLQVMAYKPSQGEQIVYDTKFSRVQEGNDRIYYYNKIIIKNNKKFYKIVSKKNNLVLDLVANFPFLRKLIFYSL